MRLFGIETEYGITRDDVPDMDPVVESMELVRAHLAASFERRWTMPVRIRMRMRAVSEFRAYNRIEKKMSSHGAMPIAPFRSMT